MGTLTYDVAVSLDGYIAGPGGDVSLFPMTGDHVDAYLKRMQHYDAVVMGRDTYEFGYQHGLAPGQAPYESMDNYVVSAAIELPDDSRVKAIRNGVTDAIAGLKAEYNSVYLCGGGHLAGGLLQAGLLDRLCLKVAPLLLHDGTPLFSESGFSAADRQVQSLRLQSATAHDNGVTTLLYDCG